MNAHYESRATGVVRRKEYTSICIPLSCSMVLTMLQQTIQGGDNLQSCGKILFHVILEHGCKGGGGVIHRSDRYKVADGW